MEDKSELKSRFTRSSSNLAGTNPDSYEFDFSHAALDPDLQLQCVPRNNVTKDDMSSKENVQHTRTSINKMVLNIEHHELEVNRKDKKKLVNSHAQNIRAELNSLPDSIYEPFHKKMLRQELKMIEADVKEGYESAEHLEQLYNKLEVITWPMALQKMTRIDDPTDDEELNLKRKMTMDKIMSMLGKYKLMTEHAAILKKHKSKLKINPFINYTKIYRNIDRMFIENYESSSDEEEEDLTVQQIREHRLKKRAQKCGGTITIGLKTAKHTESFAIIAEPLRNPYVIKLTAKERKDLEKIKPQRKVFKYSRNSKSIATLQEKRPIPLTMKLDESERERLIKEYNSTQLEDTENYEPLEPDIKKESTSQVKSGISEITNPGIYITEQQPRPVQTAQFLNGNVLHQGEVFNQGNISQPSTPVNQNKMLGQDRSIQQNGLINHSIVQDNYSQQHEIIRQNHVLNQVNFFQGPQINEQPIIIQQEMNPNAQRSLQISPVETEVKQRLIGHIAKSTSIKKINKIKHSRPIPGQLVFPIQKLHQPIASHNHENLINNFGGNIQKIIPQKRSSDTYTGPTILIPQKKSKIEE